MITQAICKVSEISDYIHLFAKEFSIPNFAYKKQGVTDLDNLLSSLRQDLKAYIEFPYVDRLYRDSYYNYYSKRNTEFSRNCIRISLFDIDLTFEHFEKEKLKKDLLKENVFLGFLIIRPTVPNRVGRNFINPKALLDNSFKIIKCNLKVSVNGLKFSTDAFPHSSQDGSYHSCAETSLWALMEYFGTKYDQYNTVLISDILRIMKRRTSERQTPSDGLTHNQMSYALRKLGFGSKIFHREVYKNESAHFENMINFYVESAIPVILVYDVGENEMHSNLVIGFDSDKSIQSNNKGCFPLNLKNNKKEKESLIPRCLPMNNRKFVLIDDNYPPYVKTNLLEGTIDDYHNDKKRKVMAFIVPHHNKVFLRISSAKEIFFSILKDEKFGINLKSKDLYYTLKLMPSRTFKEKIWKDDSIPLIHRESIISVIMPKFIWIAQFGILNLAEVFKSEGLIALDSTGSEKDDKLNTLLFTLYSDRMIFKEGILNRFEEVDFVSPLSEIKLLNNNLK